MLPLRDTIQSRQLPLVTWALIGLNILAFVFELSLPADVLDRFIQTWGMIPARLSLFDPFSWVTLVSSIFLHSGWFHLLSNLWTLFIFGDNVEDEMGSGRYLAFYLLAGISANLLQALATPGSPLPAIGASGAIAGVLGAYFFFFPRARVVTLVPLFIIPWLVEIPAIFYLGFWFVSQLFSGLASLSTPSYASMGGIAWWAHIGGFLFGLFLGRFLLRPRQPLPYYPYNQFPDDFPP
jgi:membrane associated rhomboid family serine protease